jgi:hypothetical protein
MWNVNNYVIQWVIRSNALLMGTSIQPQGTMESDGNVSTTSCKQNLSIGVLELAPKLDRVNLAWRWHKFTPIKITDQVVSKTAF